MLEKLKTVTPAAKRLLAPEHDMKRVRLSRVVVRAAGRVQPIQRSFKPLGVGCNRIIESGGDENRGQPRRGRHRLDHTQRIGQRMRILRYNILNSDEVVRTDYMP